MKKYIVLSVNDNIDYLYFTPLTCWAWRQFGWGPIVFYKDSDKEIFALEKLIWDAANNPETKLLSDQHGYRSDTITQISRLYGSCVVNEKDFIMTGDVDMIPLSSYWNPDINKVTVYGHDLTGFSHFPICYIAAPAYSWHYFMNLQGDDYNALIKKDLDKLPQAKDPDFYKYWFSDQDLITARLKEYGTGKIDFVNRGQGKHGYARGRVDRGNGGWVLDQPVLIDAHLEQQTWQNPAKIQRLYELLAYVWPKEDFTWFKTYTEEFKKLAV